MGRVKPEEGNLKAHGSQLTALLVEGEGFEPPKLCAADLQSAPFGRLGTPPRVPEAGKW